jgi:hypothetical protein
MPHLLPFSRLLINTRGANSYRNGVIQSSSVAAMRLIQRATAVLLLAVIGLPASLGAGLHWLPGACLGDTLAAQSACGPNCLYEHEAPGDANQIAADQPCLVCDFLVRCAHQSRDQT